MATNTRTTDKPIGLRVSSVAASLEATRAQLRGLKEARRSQARQQRDALNRGRTLLRSRVHTQLMGYARGGHPQEETPPAPPRPRHGGASRRQNGG